MKISINWMKQFTDVDLAPQGTAELVEKIGAQLGAVEEVIELGSRYQGVVVARVVSCEDHPNADRLHVCKVDDGGKTPDVERDENGYVQVVCGAPNVREGLLVAWLPPGSTVPESFDTDPFVLEARPLRGVVSNGMLASARELALGDSHDGILEVDAQVEPGTTFAEAYQLNDTIIDIENKMFTHRPDCFGQLGVVREIVGIRQQSFYSPDWYLHQLQDVLSHDGTSLQLTVRNELPVDVQRFMAVAMSDVEVKPSPVWLQSYLVRVGIRPINNIVDITNYMMMVTGQPLHAYDYDKVAAQDDSTQATLVVRYPAKGEKITLLNGKEIEPRSEAIMIATEKKLIGVGGAMGGADTEVDENTKNIILECATFNMYSIRRTAMTHGIFTDAVTRNNKGQSPLQNERVFAQTVAMLRSEASAQVASEVIDDNHVDEVSYERDSLHEPIKVGAEFINARLGLDLSAQEMAVLLTDVEFTVGLDGDDLIVAAPFWRTDIEIAEDIVEEVGRLYGFDKLPLQLPRRELTPAPINDLLHIKQRLRDTLSTAGANEVLSYSFVHGNLLDKVGQKREWAFSLANALSPDLQYFRPSLTPSLLDKVSPNLKAGYDKFALFELGKAHNLLHASDDNGLPREFSLLSFVTTTSDKKADPKAGAAYYEARKYLDHIASSFGITLDYAPITEDMDFPITAPFDLTRSSLVTVRHTKIFLGIVGEYRASIRKQLKLPAHTAGFEIDTQEFSVLSERGKQYRQLSRFPKVEQDICFKVSVGVSYQQLYEFMLHRVAAAYPQHVDFSITPVDIFQRPDDTDHKQITLRLSVSHFQKTLRDSEVNAVLDAIAQEAAQELLAERV